MIALSGSFKTFGKILHRILTFDLLHWPLTWIVHFTSKCYSFDISCPIFILRALGDGTRQGLQIFFTEFWSSAPLTFNLDFLPTLYIGYKMQYPFAIFNPISIPFALWDSTRWRL